MRRPPLQFADFRSQSFKIASFIQKAGAHPDNISSRGGHTFAEPQRPGVVLFGVVHGFERLRPDAFHIPQVKELVRRQIAQG